MKKKQILIITIVFVIIVALSFLASSLLLREKPTIPSRATQDTPQVCTVNTASCTWSSDDSSTSFNVKVTDETDGVIVVETTTSNKKVEFSPKPGHTYRCAVIPINSCGEGDAAEGIDTCSVITNTPTPTLTVTVSPTPESSPSVTPETSLTPTPTEEISSTPTPTPENTETPTPTGTPEPTPTEAPTETPTPTTTPNPTSTDAPTDTPQPTDSPYPSSPTIPQSGVPANWLFIVVPLAIVLLGLIF